MSGNCAIGRVLIPSTPRNKRMIEMTIANAGLWRIFANMVAPGVQTLATHGHFSNPVTTSWISGTGSNRRRNRQSGSGTSRVAELSSSAIPAPQPDSANWPCCGTRCPTHFRSATRIPTELERIEPAQSSVSAFRSCPYLELILNSTLRQLPAWSIGERIPDFFIFFQRSKQWEASRVRERQRTARSPLAENNRTRRFS